MGMSVGNFLIYLGGFCISLGLSILLIPKLIDYLKKLGYQQSVSEYALQEYKDKGKTPIMGGIAFVTIPIIVTVCLDIHCLTEIDTILVFLAFVGYGLIGFIDDYIISIKHNNDGLKPKQKFGMQLVLAVVFYLLYQSNVSTDIVIPVVKWVLPLGVIYMLLVLFMFTGTSNAVNLTDGMDGLAAGCSVLAFIPYGIFAYQQGLNSLVLFVFCLEGALFGYLKYNKHPAKVFMGDTGSLALGGGLAALALVTKQEITLIIVGGVFVWETVCVIIQQVSVRTIHKRVFRYTPIHYAFKLNGMEETSVVKMFWCIELVCAVLGLLVGVL